MRLDIVVSGLTAGSLYALVAVSLNILFRPTNVFNFAQGELVMLGAMIGAVALGALGLGWPGAVAAAVVAVGALTLLIERVAVAPIVRRSAHSTAWIISTLAVSLILTNVVSKWWGPDPVRVVAPWPLSTQAMDVAGTRISSYQIALVVFTLVAVLVIERFYGTRGGKAVLAVAEDREAALLRGIDPDRLGRWSFAIGGGVAAVAGLAAAPLLFASPDLGPLLLLKGFAAAALGGIGNNRGALLAAYLLGLSEALSSAFLTPGYQRASTLLLLLVVLLIRPQGLFSPGAARRV